MKRYLTTYRIETDKVECFGENADYKQAVDVADEWVCNSHSLERRP